MSDPRFGDLQDKLAALFDAKDAKLDARLHALPDFGKVSAFDKPDQQAGGGGGGGEAEADGPAAGAAAEPEMEPFTPQQYDKLLTAIGRCAKGDWPAIAEIVGRNITDCRVYLRRYVQQEQWCVGFDGSRLSMVAFDLAACILSRRGQFDETLKVIHIAPTEHAAKQLPKWQLSEHLEKVVVDKAAVCGIKHEIYLEVERDKHMDAVQFSE
eukprot:SAG22_NODE_6600_length_833_cov_0.918256_1_plen_210_part_10